MSSSGVNRRQALGYAGASGLGVAAGVVAGRATSSWGRQDTKPATGGMVRQQYSPYGVHQTGVTTRKPAAVRLLAFTLLPTTDHVALARLMRVWGSSIAALMEGRPAPADLARDMAQTAVSLTVTVGWGPGVFALPALKAHRPAGFQEIPRMDHDKMQDRWMGGDLLLAVSADDDTTLTYACRRLTVDAKPFASPKWVQTGSWRGVDSEGNAVTGRNHFGQIDGTANPEGDGLDTAVWSKDGWFTHGTQLVIRRIEMHLDEWDKATRNLQEETVGRTLDTGAPLTGGNEHDAMDFSAMADGRPVIALNAHARVMHPSHNGGRTMLRRGWNYTHTDDAGTTTFGLLFLAFQNSIADTFIPVQRSMDTKDALNEWVTAIGSSVFAILPGWNEDGYPGSVLLKTLT